MRIDRVKLATELARRDMTQKRLAELSGVSRATINYVRAGKSCTDEVGQKIANVLGMRVEEKKSYKTQILPRALFYGILEEI